MTTPPEVVELATASGNSFHARVLSAFRAGEWDTAVSPYYLDFATNKAREVDLVAQKPWEHLDVFGRKLLGLVLMKLFVECKYIARDVVFWFDSRDSSSTHTWLDRNASLPPNNLYTKKHHYLASDEVAKLFASGASRETENEPIYRAVNQVLHSSVYLRSRDIVSPPRRWKVPVLKALELPVLVVNSFERFYRVQMAKPDEVLRIEENFQLEVNYAYVDPLGSQKQSFFLIDVVALDRLSDFLAALDADAAAIMALLDRG